MKKFSLVANFFSCLLVLAAVQVHGSVPFDFKSEFPHIYEATRNSQESQKFSKLNDEETSLFSESERPYYSLEVISPGKTSQFSDSERPYDSLEVISPGKTSQFSESGFSQVSDYPFESFENQQVPYEVDVVPEIKSPPPSAAPPPSVKLFPLPLPSIQENACKYKCSTECGKENFPILLNLCNQVCKTRCLLRYSVLTYECTARCAESTPKIFKFDKKKADDYMNYCSKKCTKKF